MARRFVETTWNNAAAPKKLKKPKPVDPLRYRIDPLEKEWDKLDQLEAELERKADTMEPEQYEALWDTLAARRERLEARRLRALGIKPAKPERVPTVKPAPVRIKARVVPYRGLSDFQAKLLAVFVVLIFFKIFA